VLFGPKGQFDGYGNARNDAAEQNDQAERNEADRLRWQEQIHPTRTRKTFTPGPTPKQIDRFQLIAIIRASAQSPDAIPDPALDALADAAMLSREVVRTYYKQCWQRMFEIYRTMYTQPLPPPSFDDIDPGF